MAPLITSDTSAPPFRLAALDGQAYTLHGGGPNALRLLLFFHTDCPTMPLLLPYLQCLHDTYSGPGLAVWGISQDPVAPTAAFVGRFGAGFPILLDEMGAPSRAYGIYAVPTLILVDEEGAVRWVGIGLNKDSLNMLAMEVATRLGREPVEVAPLDDGVPLFRPG